ncbi:MAG: metallophosphoesterase [Myxococcota bacterium]|nr:metallophosphoesterase [Myxococcota bacterium]
MAAAALMMMLFGCASSHPPALDAGGRRDGGSANSGPADAGRFDGGPLERDASVGDAGLLPPGSWSVVVLPDTQILARDHPEIFRAQTAWIVQQRELMNTRFALHVGDIVDDNSPAQWRVAAEALHAMDGHVPYVLAAGNHDYGFAGSASDRSTLLTHFFPVSTFSSEPSFGGTFQNGMMDNSYSVFETPSEPWLVISLEFGPRDDVLVWANDVIRRHAPMRTILVTHAYLYSDDSRYDWYERPDQQWNPHSYGLASLSGGVNDGQEMFDSFVRDNDDIELVLSGHVLNDGIARLTSPQQGGGRVHQLLANFQHQPEGGAGFLRILTFDASGTHITVRTYSPYLDEWKTDPDNQFELDL